QGAINDALSTESSDDVFKIDLPSKIKKVCFGNLSAKITNLDDYEQVKDYDIYQANVFLIPTTEAGNMPWKIINHLNITKITEKQNPYCIFVSREIKIKKEFYDRLVRVE
ncbi:MAG: hypothetical protein Q8N88_00475, partial [Nanoarchaeota archaeon]|nr:hypothetical protein [Nanoarchaeota archaeon]